MKTTYPAFCPNNGFKQPMTFWTASSWHNGEFITEYWRGCRNYVDARTNHDYNEMDKHWAKWQSTQWADARRSSLTRDERLIG